MSAIASFDLDTGTPGLCSLISPLSEATRFQLAANARLEHQGEQSIEHSVQLLRTLGWLAGAMPVHWGGAGIGQGGRHGQTSVRRLMDIAEVNLPAARLYEGHVNAMWLLGAYGDLATQTRAAELASSGSLFGVWGADDASPVTFDQTNGDLSGQKRFASGLGSVSYAVITARCGSATQMCLADVTDSSRADSSGWSMTGMRATVSGSYIFDNMANAQVQCVGAPGDFDREPGLVSGVWRIAALQLGGTFGLLEATRAALRGQGRLNNEAHLSRLTPVLFKAHAGIDLIARAAIFCEADAAWREPERAVALSIYARLMSAEVAQSALQAVEQSLGLAHFCEQSNSGRIARDLSTYIRQIAPDAFMQRSGRYSMDSTQRLSYLFDSEHDIT